MAITSDRLKQTFSEGGAQEIYHEIKSSGDFLGFTEKYAFDADYRVARSALWGLTKANDKELSQLQVLLDELIDQAKEKKHMTASQAATIARDAQVRRMCMIHYSPRYTDRDLEKLLEQARAVWPATELSRDRMQIEIPYID